MSENTKYDWVNPVLGKHVDLCILVASFVLRGMRKMWRENEREREIDGTLSLFSQSNRFVYLETTACPPESSFPEHRASPWISFLLCDCRRFTPRFGFLPFDLSSFLPGGRGRQDRGRKCEEFNCVILIYSDIPRFCREKMRTTQHWYKWSIKASPHLAEILMVKFNVTRKNCVTHPLPSIQ